MKKFWKIKSRIKNESKTLIPQTKIQTSNAQNQIGNSASREMAALALVWVPRCQWASVGAAHVSRRGRECGGRRRGRRVEGGAGRSARHGGLPEQMDERRQGLAVPVVRPRRHGRAAVLLHGNSVLPSGGWPFRGALEYVCSRLVWGSRSFQRIDVYLVSVCFFFWFDYVVVLIFMLDGLLDSFFWMYLIMCWKIWFCVFIEFFPIINMG